MSLPRTKADDQRVADVWDEKEQARIDEMSCDFSPHECKSGKQVSRLLNILDTLPTGKGSK